VLIALLQLLFLECQIQSGFFICILSPLRKTKDSEGGFGFVGQATNNGKKGNFLCGELLPSPQSLSLALRLGTTIVVAVQILRQSLYPL
jgi:hypothetical protein